MNGFERRRQKKKEDILNALSKMLIERHYGKIGVREIAELAGVSPASIYSFFGSKEELAVELVFKYLAFLRGRTEASIDEAPSFAEKVEKLQGLLENLVMETAMDIFNNLPLDDPSVERHIADHIEHVIEDIVGKVLEQGRAEGRIMAPLSPKAVGLYMRTMLKLASDPALRAGVDTETRRGLSSLVLYGLFGRL